MTSSKPYLLRALYQWIVDNDMTPQILVASDGQSGSLPQQYVKDGKIVLNIAPQAIRGLEIADDAISFSARFGGNPMNVLAPIAQVLAIYARENGQGMLFSAEDPVPQPPQGSSENGPAKSTKPQLKLVK